MRAIERILFPVDFSPQHGAAHYEGYGGRHCRGDDLHAINRRTFFTAGELGGYVVNDFYQIHLNDTKKKLGDYLRPEFPNASRETCEGEAASRIVAFAKSHDIDLIMLPTHGLGPFRRFLIGSITAKVLHDAHLPGGTGVHGKPSPCRVRISRTDTVVDLGPADATPAGSTAAAHGGKVTIVHAVPVIETRPAKHRHQSSPNSSAGPAEIEASDRVHSDVEGVGGELRRRDPPASV
jgi:nucleotide-binding universal stress UspA family protein